jgi:hypothetical protein
VTATDIELDHNGERKGRFSLRRMWKPLIYSLKEGKKVLSKDKLVTSS